MSSESFNLFGDYIFRLRYYKGAYLATLVQMDGQLKLTSGPAASEMAAWGKLMIALKNHQEGNKQ